MRDADGEKCKLSKALQLGFDSNISTFNIVGQNSENKTVDIDCSDYVPQPSNKGLNLQFTGNFSNCSFNVIGPNKNL